MPFYAALILAVVYLGGLASSEKETIELLTLLPYYNSDPSFLPSWSAGDDIFPALQLARDQINNDASLLPNYNLKLIQGRSGCQFSEDTVANFLQNRFYSESRRIVGVVGPGCSSSTLALAPVTNKSEVSMVMVHAAGAAALASRTEYPYVLGSLGSTDDQAYAIYSLIQGKWDKIALLYDESRPFFLHLLGSIMKYLDNSVRTLPIPVFNDFILLNVVRDEEVRVVLVMCSLDLTRRIICLSWKEKMLYSDYQLVFTVHTELDLVHNISFRHGGKDVFCSVDDMQQALRMQIFLLDSIKTTIVGQLGAPLNTSYSSYVEDYEQYRTVYNNKKEYIGAKSKYTVWAGYMYDTVWGWAKVLDSMSRTYPNFFDSSSIVDKNLTKAELIVNEFYRTRFNGVTGLFNFERESGLTSRPIKVEQIQANGVNTVWLVDRIAQNATGTRPVQIPSSFPMVRENKYYVRLMAFVVVLIILVTALMHVLTCKYRMTPTVKATTVNLLHISYVGVYVMLVGLFVFMLFPAFPLPLELRDKFDEVLQTWTLPVGFTLSLGSVGMRTWRVYRIFVHYLNPGPFITNRILLLGVLLLVAIDVAVACAWTLTKELLLTSSQHPLQEDENSSLRETTNAPSSTRNWVFYAVLVNKAILILWVTTLAFLTKDIKQLSFTTNSLRIFVYIATIISTLGISLTFLFSSSQFHPTFVFASLSTTVIFVCIAFIGCVFLPPLLPTLKSFFQRGKLVVLQEMPWKRKCLVNPVDYSAA